MKERLLKHDSWAATALYRAANGDRIACKLNREAPILGLGTRWIGRRLAAREERLLKAMEGVEGFAQWAGPVSCGGRPLLNAVAHRWIDGRTFSPSLELDEEFFPRLRRMLEALHRHDIAYVDLAKWENILVGEDGRPHLIDFQVHYRHPRGWPGRSWLLSLQQSDRYHLHKHWSRVRPQQLTEAERDLASQRPWVLRLAHRLGPPLRALRLFLLRLWGVRA